MTAIAAAVFLCLTLSAGVARADQNDERLDDLFARLAAAKDVEEARPIEADIWHIWIASEDSAVEALMNEGVGSMNRQDLPRALEYFDQVVAIAPDFAEGWNKRATVHYLLSNFAESLADIERTLALEPRHFGALSGRGLVYFELKEEDLALDSFEEALTIHPRMPGARSNAEALRKRLGDREI
jgi:tetratricopeptide (TPR) repeat protein